MEAEIWAAMLGALASLVVAVFGLLNSWRTRKASRETQEQLELLKNELAERSATRNAWREYEFEARKRLYEQCAPLIFELSELSERALGRIYGLARTAAAGDLDSGKSWLNRDYYSLSTHYRLLAPLAVGRLLRRRLTHLDLSIDPTIYWQYTLVKVLSDSFTDDFDLAGGNEELKIDEVDWLEYSPHAPDASDLREADPAKYWQQGVPRGILGDAVEALIVKERGGSARLIEFSEFQTLRHDSKSGAPLRQAFDRIAYLFSDFHPETRPVLWRILVAQACLYESLLLSRRLIGAGDATLGSLQALDRAKLDWRQAGADDENDLVGQSIRVGVAYAEQKAAASWKPAVDPGQRAD